MPLQFKQQIKKKPAKTCENQSLDAKRRSKKGGDIRKTHQEKELPVEGFHVLDIPF